MPDEPTVPENDQPVGHADDDEAPRPRRVGGTATATLSGLTASNTETEDSDG